MSRAHSRRSTDTPEAPSPAPAPAEEPKRHWYLDRRISLDTIVQIIGMAVVLGGPFVLWGRSMEQAQINTASKVALIESAASQRSQFDQERASESAKRQQEMQASIARLDDKLQALQLQVVQALNVAQAIAKR